MPALERAAAMTLAATEYQRFVAQLRRLDDADWAKPTPCPEWDVHAMVCHVLGSAEMSASVAEQIRQVRGARKAGGLFIDALTSLQVRKHVQLSPAELVEAMAAVGPKAATGRRRTPSLVRRIPMKDMPVDETGARTEAWQLGFLVDVVLTRDTWMHRSDIGAAVGRPMVLRPDHDGAIVADVVAEWAARHGQPCSLTLTGPAGGTWELNGARAAGGSAAYELDAVEFCRILSGRGSGEGLLATRVPF
jgi:uncharacterized protein (TIGR03083 family)